MEEILHHLGSIKTWKSRDIYHVTNLQLAEISGHLGRLPLLFKVIWHWLQFTQIESLTLNNGIYRFKCHGHHQAKYYCELEEIQNQLRAAVSPTIKPRFFHTFLRWCSQHFSPSLKVFGIQKKKHMACIPQKISGWNLTIHRWKRKIVYKKT